MIIHFFTARRYHLVPVISKGFATDYLRDAEHFFVLCGNDKLDRKLYIELFKQLEFNNYEFCLSYWQLFKLLLRFRKQTLLFHAGSYSLYFTALLLNCKNINWVCWGGGTTISNNWRSKIGGIVKRVMFSRYNSIVTLMEPERKEIIENFGLSPLKIQTISYTTVSEDETKIDDLCEKLLRAEVSYNDKPVVLLGNSHHWIDSYISLLDILKPYKGKIQVQCMLNYKFEKGPKYESLISKGYYIFGDDFKTNETFYSDRAEYIRYMNGCDIYICAVEQQTGLGAIYTCLCLGKKIYITGNNLDWVCQAFDPVVFHLDTIKEGLSFEDFIKPISIEEKLRNYQSIVDSKRINRENWHHYLKKIDQV